MTNNIEEKLLGIKFDSKLSFENYISSVIYINLSKQKALMKTFVISHFKYYPLVWMFHGRKLNQRLNSIHERALRNTYQDYKSTCLELVQKENSATIHQRNLQVLATEIFKQKMIYHLKL